MIAFGQKAPRVKSDEKKQSPRPPLPSDFEVNGESWLRWHYANTARLIGFNSDSLLAWSRTHWLREAQRRFPDAGLTWGYADWIWLEVANE